MFLVSALLSRVAGRSSRIAKFAFPIIVVFTAGFATMASVPVTRALASTPTITAPSPTAFKKNVAGQEPGNFVIANFGADDVLLVSVGLVNPPTGTSFVLPTTTGLTAGFGYNFIGTKTQISFTATQEDANAALAAMTVTTGSNNGDVVIRVSASLSASNVYFNPINGHYYEFVSAPATTDCKEGADATCITNIEDAIAPKTLYGAQGYWATITSSQENTFVGDNMDAPNIAIGMSDRETEGTWRWLHGPEKGESTFFNWAGNEPNNYDPCGTADQENYDPSCIPGEDYVVTNWREDVGLWNDYGRPRFGDELSYIVEYSTDCYSVNSGECVAGDFSGSSQASATVTSVIGWNSARPAQFPAGMPVPPYATFNSVSCASPGNCTAVGNFQVPIENTESSTSDAVTMTSTNGVWAPVRTAVFAADIQNELHDATFTSVSCASAGNCTAVGSFKSNEGILNSGIRRAFTMTSTSGVWDIARPAELPDGVKWPTTEQDGASHYGIDGLNSVSCASPGNCTAVGFLTNYVTDGREAFTMTSTSGVWGVARLAEFATGYENDSHDAVFNSVSCTTEGNCTAVGKVRNAYGAGEIDAFTMTSTMTSTGMVWNTARPAVFPSDVQRGSPQDEFSSVSCSSAGNCTAVGKFVNSFGMLEAITMTSTRGVWSLVRPAVFTGGVQSQYRGGMFYAVSCSSQGNCTATGFFVNNNDESQAFTMSMANGEWDLGRPAEFDFGVENTFRYESLNSVSCASPGNCTAAGQFRNSNGADAAFTMTSTNGVWALAEPAAFSDSAVQGNYLSVFNSVSCASPGNCTAAGQFDSNSGWRAFTATLVNDIPSPPREGWDVAKPAEFPNGIFGFSEIVVTSVSCASPGNCTVVGGFFHITRGIQPFTMTSTNGVWAPAQAAEFPEGAQPTVNTDARFNWVSCASPGNCTAVGNFLNSDASNEGAHTEAFTMTSTNGVWALARPAEFDDQVQANSPYASFSSVSCASPGNCTAVGQFRDVNLQNQAFTMTSINGVWALAQPAAFPDSLQSPASSSFNSVSCASTGNCTTVGQFQNELGAYEALTMTSTNGVWALARPAEFGDQVQANSPYASFSSVSCASPGNCTAVGSFNHISNGVQAFTMTSTNGVWALARPAAFPDSLQSPASSSFNSVSCASPRNCTAVGSFIHVTNGVQAFTMTSTDGVWELAQPAAFSDGDQSSYHNDLFSSVSCASPGNCTAVGKFTNVASQSAAFTMTSTDGVWELARPAAFPRGVQSDFPPSSFTSISCTAPGNCTAAGDFILARVGSGAMFTMSSTKAVPVTTTTVPSPSTTVASPTTTAAEVTTTLVSPTTTTVPSPSTTVASPTTTFAIPITTKTTVAPTVKALINVSTKSVGTLPMTGNGFGLAYFAMYILIIGALILLARKRLYK